MESTNNTGLFFFIGVLLVAVLAYSFLSTNQIALENTSMFTASATPKIDDGNINVYFCPEDECASELIKRIDSAQKTIDIAIYSFTLDNISEALVSAKERGVNVRIVFDYGQSSNAYSEDENLIASGILVKRRDGSGYMHNKFMIIDGELVATGSFNYSDNADTKNDENLIFILSKELAKQYESEFEELLSQATK